MKRLLGLAILFALLLGTVEAPLSRPMRGHRPGTGIRPAPPVFAPPVSCDYFAAPAPDGDPAHSGLSQGSPFRPVDFWALGQSQVRGKTLCLMDGTYQGANFMIAPTAGMTGTSSARITVKALNDGGALIDGQFARPALKFCQNSFFVIQGVNFKHGGPQVAVFGDCIDDNTPPGSDSNIVRRSIFWDNTGNSNSSCVEIAHGQLNLFEDIAIFGMCRSSWHVFNGNVGNICRRCFARTEGNMYDDGPTHAFQPAYGSVATNSQTLMENVIGTWYALSMPTTYTGGSPPNVVRNNAEIFQAVGPLGSEANCGENQQIRLLGSLFYLRSSDSISSQSNPSVLVNLRRENNVTLRDVYGIVPSGFAGAGGIPVFQLGDWPCSPTPSGGVATRITSVTQGGNSINTSAYAVTQHSTGSTAGSVASPWSDAGGANLCWRYIDGVRQDGTGGTTAAPLWPWPMNQRIIDALAIAGTYTGPCTSCSGGRSTRSGTANVTADVETLLGTIPAGCKS